MCYAEKGPKKTQSNRPIYGLNNSKNIAKQNAEKNETQMRGGALADLPCRMGMYVFATHPYRWLAKEDEKNKKCVVAILKHINSFLTSSGTDGMDKQTRRSR